MPKEFEDKNYIEQHPEAKEQYEAMQKRIEDAKDRLKNDKNLNVIFARQEYSLREGTSLGLDPNKCYLYLKANDEFLRHVRKQVLVQIRIVGKRLGKLVHGCLVERVNSFRHKITI